MPVQSFKIKIYHKDYPKAAIEMQTKYKLKYLILP